jgi:hypothetical protein
VVVVELRQVQRELAAAREPAHVLFLRHLQIVWRIRTKLDDR